MKLNIQTKLVGGFLIAVGLLITVAVVGYSGISGIDRAAGDLRKSADLDDGTMNMQLGLLEAMDVQSQALIFGYSVELEAGLVKSIEEYAGGVEAVAGLADESQLVLLEELINDHRQLIAAVRGTIGLVKEGRTEEAIAYSLDVTGPVLDEMWPQVLELELEVEAFGDQATRNQASTTSTATMLLIVNR